MGAKWIKYKVSEIAAPIKNALVGGPFGSNLVSKDYKESGVPVIRGQNMGYGRWVAGDFAFVSEGKAESLSANTARPGDLVFTQRGTLGQVAIVPQGPYKKYIISQSQMKLSADPRKADISFLYYLFTSPEQRQYIQTNAIQVGVPHTNLGILKDTPILLPCLETQKEIAKLLGSLDDKIEINRQINETLEEMAQAIFKSWFVAFEPVKAKIEAKENGQNPERAAMCAISGKTNDELDQLTPEQLAQLTATAALFPDELVDSELGLIPNGWRVGNVGNIVKRLKPKKRYTKKQVVEYGSVPVYEQGASILLGYHSDEPGFNGSPKEPLFIFGDHTCVCHLSCAPFDISQNVIPLSGKKYPTLWVYYAVKGKQKFQEYRRHWSELIIKEVIEPKIEICQFFSETVTKLYQKKEQSIEENNNLRQLSDTLLPKLLSGKIELKQKSITVNYGQ